VSMLERGTHRIGRIYAINVDQPMAHMHINCHVANLVIDINRMYQSILN
jgi:hypothetical protein